MANSPPVDFKTYKTFWQLQRSLANPKQIMLSTGAWAQFLQQTEFAIGLFEVHEATAVSLNSSSSAESATDADSAAASVGATDIEHGGFGVKYLTKKQLLTLQLRDPQVQRQVMLQVRYCIADRSIKTLCVSV